MHRLLLLLFIAATEDYRSPLSPFVPHIGSSASSPSTKKDTAYDNLGYIIIVMPTYHRFAHPIEQEELLCVHGALFARSTSQNHSRILWVVVDDANATRPSVEAILRESGLSNVIYRAVGPTRDKGHAQRNLALTLVRQRVLENDLKGVVFNLDDDLRWDPRLLTEELPKLEKGRVGALAVGNQRMAKRGKHDTPISKPLWDKAGGSVKGFKAGLSGRKFAVDMAGFALDADLLRPLGRGGVVVGGGGGGGGEPAAAAAAAAGGGSGSSSTSSRISEDQEGQQQQQQGAQKLVWPLQRGLGGETEFLEQILESPNELQPLGGPTCEKVLVWHNGDPRNWDTWWGSRQEHQRELCKCVRRSAELTGMTSLSGGQQEGEPRGKLLTRCGVS
jgi:hypothetical protein